MTSENKEEQREKKNSKQNQKQENDDRNSLNTEHEQNNFCFIYILLLSTIHSNFIQFWL